MEKAMEDEFPFPFEEDPPIVEPRRRPPILDIPNPEEHPKVPPPPRGLAAALREFDSPPESAEWSRTAKSLSKASIGPLVSPALSLRDALTVKTLVGRLAKAASRCDDPGLRGLWTSEILGYAKKWAAAEGEYMSLEDLAKLRKYVAAAETEPIPLGFAASPEREITLSLSW